MFTKTDITEFDCAVSAPKQQRGSKERASPIRGGPSIRSSSNIVSTSWKNMFWKV